MAKKIVSDIWEIKLANEGRKRIEWAGRSMEVVRLIGERFKREKPFKGLTIGACLHVTSETANLMLTLKAGGAKVALCASNPLSTNDAVAASLVKDYGINVWAIHGEDTKTYYRHLDQVLDLHPEITMDDGADLVSSLHAKRPKQLKEVFGSSEETTTGVIRLMAMARDRALKIPVVAVNESDTKHLFDNRYGTGQSTIDGIIRATNVLLAGKIVVVGGYGLCSRGIAMRARGFGAKVVVTEVDPVRALEAHMDGYQVLPMKRAAKVGDIFVTATGDKAVVSLEHIQRMKDGVILANSGHFNVEVEYDRLKKAAKRSRLIRENLEEFEYRGKKVYVIGEGRLVNLVAAEGHPAEVMDMSFANQALAAEWLVKNHDRLKPKVYTLPKKLDRQVARLKLKALGVKIDRLTREQRKYLTSWQEGT
ncbi:adenosylhomocysteinase [Microgenomates group bacterium RBG_16_45_19]|nr:MAG: adenosylhomocysteinase [Microgenomates group bacterium RBG_16_45_19]